MTSDSLPVVGLQSSNLPRLSANRLSSSPPSKHSPTPSTRRCHLTLNAPNASFLSSSGFPMRTAWKSGSHRSQSSTARRTLEHLTHRPRGTAWHADCLRMSYLFPFGRLPSMSRLTSLGRQHALYFLASRPTGSRLAARRRTALEPLLR